MTPDSDPEASRVRDVYRRRGEQGLDSRYAYWQPANLFIYQSRERVIVSLLEAAGLLPLSGKQVLDAGCGDGSVLRDLLRFGAEPENLHGVDLLSDRIERARTQLPSADIRLGDARALPITDDSCDLVLGFTLLSSVLDDAVRAEITREMLRVTRPGGLILIYDFWINPFNRDARALKRSDVRKLFFGREVKFESTTLAPPLLRRLIGLPGGRLACELLEVIPCLQTHYVAAIRA